MELLLILAFIWLVGAMFPGSGGGFVDVAGAVASLLAGIIGFALLFGYWAASIAGIVWIAERVGGAPAGHGMILLAMFAPIVVPMLIAGGVEWARNRR